MKLPKGFKLIKMNQETAEAVKTAIDNKQVEMQLKFAEQNHRTILNIDDMGGQFRFHIEQGVSIRTLVFALSHLLKDLVDADLTDSNVFIKELIRDYIKIGGKYDKSGNGE